MKAKEDIVKKIKNLLSLGDKNKNNSDEEAKASLLKAQELMAKYDISIEECQEKEEPEYSHERCEHKWNYSYRVPLALVLAKNFRCMVYTIDNQIVFMGHTTDAKICKETFEYAYTFIMKRGSQIYNKKYQLGLQTKGVFNSYAKGFILGLQQAFDTQCVALAITTPPDVIEHFEEMSKDWAKKKTKNLDAVDSTTFKQGVEEGRAFMEKDKLPE